MSGGSWCWRKLLSCLLLFFVSFLVTPCLAFVTNKTSLPSRDLLRLGSIFGRHTRKLSSKLNMTPTIYPELVVFDLDACFWDQEMYQMNAIPTQTREGDLNGRGKGVIAALSGGEPIRLHKGSLQAMQDHADGKFPNTKFIFASSADTPFAEKVGRASLRLLEVLPGMTVWDLVVGRDWKGEDVNQIGRQPPLSSNKARSHFPRIRELTGMRYDRMLFFDDCNWGDHCGMVQAGCREPETNTGPATVRTPDGLGVKEWEDGLKAYERQALKLGVIQK
jgi:magnesium-dependent phosphatase 1